MSANDGRLSSGGQMNSLASDPQQHGKPNLAMFWHGQMSALNQSPRQQSAFSANIPTHINFRNSLNIHTNGLPNDSTGNSPMYNFQGIAQLAPPQQNISNNEEAAAIYERNNVRLRQIEKELQQFITYGSACDELLAWLQDRRAYNALNESQLIRCLYMTCHFGTKFGVWSALQIMNTVYGNLQLFSTPSQVKITHWRDNILAEAFGKRTRENSNMASLPSPASQSQYPDTYASFSQHTMATSHPTPHQTMPSDDPKAMSGTALYAGNQSLSSHALLAPPFLPTTTSFSASTFQVAPQPYATKPVAQTTVPIPPAHYSTVPQYLQYHSYAIPPFRLQHSHTVTRVPFFISPASYRRLWKANQQHAAKDPTELPLSYILTAWRAGGGQTKCEWPMTAIIDVNGRTPKLTRRMKTRQGERAVYIGKDKPFEMGAYLVEGENCLQIRQVDCACSFWFCVQIYVRETEEVIQNKVKSAYSSKEAGHAMVNRLLGNTSITSFSDDVDEDDDIKLVQSQVKLNLKCPISLLRMKQPVRGADCKHIACFDLTSYLSVNQNTTKWKCPHCSNHVPSHKLLRDEFVESLLKMAPKDACELQFTTSSNNWEVSEWETKDLDDALDKPSPLQQTQKQESSPMENVIIIDSDDDNDTPESRSCGTATGTKQRVT